MQPDESLPPTAQDIERINKGVALAKRARSWIEAHKEGFEQLLETARQLNREGYTVTRDEMYTRLKREHKTQVTDTAQWLRAHDLWSGVARYMLREDEGLRISITGRCTIDAAYPSLDELPAVEWR